MFARSDIDAIFSVCRMVKQYRAIIKSNSARKNYCRRPLHSIIEVDSERNTTCAVSGNNILIDKEKKKKKNIQTKNQNKTKRDKCNNRRTNSADKNCKHITRLFCKLIFGFLRARTLSRITIYSTYSRIVFFFYIYIFAAATLSRRKLNRFQLGK